MTGTPTQVEIQTQWRNAVDVLETIRNFVDGTVASSSGKLETLVSSLEGEYTPAELTSWSGGVRQSFSDLLSSSFANQMTVSLLFEYGRYISDNAATDAGFGSGYRNPGELFRAIYEWFASGSPSGLTVQSRDITFVAASAGSANVGQGSMSRLATDENNFAMEAVTVERKNFRCRADSTSGTQEQAEVFEVMGEASSFDNVLRPSFGSGESARTTLVSKHAGSGTGGSLANNSSFSDYTATATPKFTGWTETAGGANATQATGAGNFYRSYPGATVDASVSMAGTGGTTTLTQPLTAMRVRRLDPNVPYFLRCMIKATGGADGDFKLSLGSQTVTVANASFTGGWQEVLLPLDQNCWLRNFNEASTGIVVQWLSPAAGTLLVDDLIFAPMSLIDGSYYVIRQAAATAVPWRVDDTLYFTDTGGAPATGKVQYYLWLAGLGYLPSTTGVPTFTDPS